MKKKILIVVMLLVTGFSSTFANNAEGINEKVTASFKKEFTLAQDVKWETGKELVKATFTLNEQVMFAYYSAGGELLAVTRNLVSGQLPINLLTELKKNYNGNWIADLFEMSTTSGTSYYITLENADFTFVLKSNGTNSWSLYKKARKNIA